MENIPDRIDSRFRYVLLAAERAEQMMRGARSNIEGQAGKLTRVAMEEIATDAVVWDYGPPPPPEEVEPGAEADADA